jgi:hypothetical protein
MPSDGNAEGSIEVETPPQFHKFQTLVEFSCPGAGNGSVVYETPPQLNARLPTPKHHPSTVVTFTPQVIVSDEVDTHVPLLHYSMNPSYDRIVRYVLSVFSIAGKRLVTEEGEIGPFAVKLLKIKDYRSPEPIERHRHSQDWLATFTFVATVKRRPWCPCSSARLQPWEGSP